MQCLRSKPVFLGAMILAAGLLTGCPSNSPVPFNMTVMPAEIVDSIPGQRCVFLVQIEPTGYLNTPVEITVEVNGEKADAYVDNNFIDPNEVAEVSVIPKALAAAKQDEGRDVKAIIRGEFDGAVRWQTVTVHVTSEEEDLVAPRAEELRDFFIPWLEANRPELGITAATSWEGTIVSPHILVVTHYLFFSNEWEMHIFWHVMTPPNDWARIELRHRFYETLPSLAFEIPSVDAGAPYDIVETQPSDTLWR